MTMEAKPLETMSDAEEASHAAGVPSNRLQAIFQDFAAAEFDKQLHVGEVLGKHTWTLDWNRGLLTLVRSPGTGTASRHSLPVQVLGVEQYETRCWHWGWSEVGSRFPDSSLRLARFLRGVGERRGIEEFCRPLLPAAGLLPQQLAMTASGLFSADGYYRAAYGGGAVHLLLRDPLLRRRVEDPVGRAAVVFPNFARTYAVPNARRAFMVYAEFLGLTPRDEGRYVLATAPGGAAIWAEFGSGGKFHRLLVQVGGSDQISLVDDRVREMA